MSETATELRRIADQVERWARYDDVIAPGLDDAATLRQAADLLAATRSGLAEIVKDSEVTNHNSDGDELTGCRWCDTLWGHSEGCPIERIEHLLKEPSGD